MIVERSEEALQQARLVIGPAIAGNDSYEVVGYLPETTEALLRHRTSNVYVACLGPTLRHVNPPYSRKGIKLGAYKGAGGVRNISMGSGQVSDQENREIKKAKSLLGSSWADYHVASARFWIDFFGQLQPGDWEVLKEIEQRDGISAGANAGALVCKFLREREALEAKLKGSRRLERDSNKK